MCVRYKQKKKKKMYTNNKNTKTVYKKNNNNNNDDIVFISVRLRFLWMFLVKYLAGDAMAHNWPK